jgi:murein DD-endopeptidase MepM/ murein hydrolase activator NlpD
MNSDHHGRDADGTSTGWFADPYGRHLRRYFDGQRWTAHVADGRGRQFQDPHPCETRPAAPETTSVEPNISRPGWVYAAAAGGTTSSPASETVRALTPARAASMGDDPSARVTPAGRNRLRAALEGRLRRLIVGVAGVVLIPAAVSAFPGGPSPELRPATVPADNVFPIGEAGASCTDGYGDARSGGRSHAGVDCFAQSGIGAALVAVEAGVIDNTWDPANQEPCKQGYAVAFRGASGTRYYYGHLDRVDVSLDQPVTRGQVLGTLGQTGNADPVCGGGGPHLHFEMRPDGENTVDPYPYTSTWPIVGAEAPGTPPPGDGAQPEPGGDAHDPIGTFDQLEPRGGGEIEAWGWAVDEDTPTTSIAVHVYVTGSDGERRFYEFAADESRPDLVDAHPAYGDRHGYSAVIGDLPAGETTVDVYAIDSSNTADDYTHIGTKNVVVTGAETAPPPAPDTTPQTTSPTTVPAEPPPPPVTTTPPPATTTPPSVTTTPPPATTTPPPVQNPPPPVPTTTTPPPPTPTTSAPPPDTNTPTTPPAPSATDANDPVGAFDHLDAGADGSIGMWGWAVDGDTPTTALAMHIYVTTSTGDVRRHVLLADHLRDDLADVFPSSGGHHGWEAVITDLPPGTATVEAFAVDSSGKPKDYTHLGTRRITVE